jgi:hypothetical protein
VHYLEDFNFLNVEQNYVKKIYRATTPSRQRKTRTYIPNLGAPFGSAQDLLCAFARDIVFFNSEFQVPLASFCFRVASFDG